MSKAYRRLAFAAVRKLQEITTRNLREYDREVYDRAQNALLNRLDRSTRRELESRMVALMVKAAVVNAKKVSRTRSAKRKAGITAERAVIGVADPAGSAALSKVDN